MQEQWKDLIPFYVAGTLDEQRKQALEAYLQQCGDPCLQEVEEWRQIASLTWQSVVVDASDVPSLSQAVRAEVAQSAELRASGKVISSELFTAKRPQSVTQAPVYTRDQARIKQRRPSRIPLTMVAAFMTVVIFGGILVSQLTPEDLEPQTILLTEVPNTDVELTREFGGNVGILPDNPDSGILSTPTPFAPQPTRTPLPTLPPEALFTTTPFPLPTQPQASELGFNPIQECMVRNDTQGALTVYRDASFSANSVGIMQAGQENTIRVTYDGWYELSYGRWVHGENLLIFGDCSAVITATPTAIGDNPDDRINNGIPVCVIRNDGTDPVNLYQWADYDSPVNGRFPVGEQVDVAIGQNGWYQVFYAQWVNSADVTVEGEDCNTLWIPTPTGSPVFVPSATPTYNPNIDPDAAVAVIKTSSTIARTTPSTLGVFVQEVVQGTNLPIIAHNNVTGPQRWYLVSLPTDFTAWIPSLDVDVIPNDLEVAPAATVPFIPTVTPQGFVPTPIHESWSHMTTVTEHGCGGIVGQQDTIAVQLRNYGTEIVLTYRATGQNFVLDNIAPNAFAGSYGTSAFIQVDLTFTSGTTYTASETITQESGCIVRMTWAGSKQQ